MKLYTIGFTKKSAEIFFGTLRCHGIQRLIDIRLNPRGQLSGFAKESDLPYLLSNLASGCRYIRVPELAPTKDILDDYRLSGDWSRYAGRFESLMGERKIPEALNRTDFEQEISWLLCSEPTPEQCHRRLVAERLACFWTNVEVIHL